MIFKLFAKVKNHLILYKNKTNMLLTNYMLQKSNQTKLCLNLSKDLQFSNWKQLIPTDDFGWTGSILNKKEKMNYYLIEKLINNQPKLVETSLIKSVVSSKINVLSTTNSPMFLSKFNFFKSEFIFNRVIGNYIRRNELPNLAYCFGVLNDQSMILEYQKNSITLREYLKSTDFNFHNLLLILIQLLNIELYLFQICQFSHNDFHLENILVRPTNNQKWKIPLLSTTQNSYRTIQTATIPIIIDMGLATFHINDELSFINKSNLNSILTDFYFLFQQIDSLVNDERTKSFMNSLDGFNQFLLGSVIKTKTTHLSFLFENKINTHLFDDDIRTQFNQTKSIEMIVEQLINFVWNQIPNELKNDHDTICPDIKIKVSPTSNKKRKFIESN